MIERVSRRVTTPPHRPPSRRGSSLGRTLLGDAFASDPLYAGASPSGDGRHQQRPSQMESVEFALDSVVSCAIISTIDGKLRHAGHTAATGPAPSYW
jgi:hypothetical protein